MSVHGQLLVAIQSTVLRRSVRPHVRSARKVLSSTQGCLGRRQEGGVAAECQVSAIHYRNKCPFSFPLISTTDPRANGLGNNA